MEKPVQIFKSFAEAEEADRKYYQSLTPAQRIQILLLLRNYIIHTMMEDLKESVELLNSRNLRPQILTDELRIESVPNP